MRGAVNADGALLVTRRAHYCNWHAKTGAHDVGGHWIVRMPQPPRLVDREEGRKAILINGLATLTVVAAHILSRQDFRSGSFPDSAHAIIYFGLMIPAWAGVCWSWWIARWVYERDLIALIVFVWSGMQFYIVFADVASTIKFMGRVPAG
jgi:hypothetical protein